MNRLWNWIKRLKWLFVARPCERCGGPDASLVIDAIPAGKKVDGRTGLVTKTFTVRSADWVCRGCRRKAQAGCGSGSSESVAQ